MSEKKLLFTIAVMAMVGGPLFAAFGNLEARFFGGKTYITFSEDTGTGHTYRLYRSAVPIALVDGLSPYATIPDSSSFIRKHGVYCVARDSGALLTAETGIFVYTPKDTTDVYYAVTVVRSGIEDRAVSPGVNSLSTPVHEEWWSRPRGLLHTLTVSSGYLNYLFQFWMDYDTWPHTQDTITKYWGASKSVEPACDFFRVVVPPPQNRNGLSRLPVLVNLHSLGYCGWGMPLQGFRAGRMELYVRDHQQTWYTCFSGDRVISAVNAALNEPRLLPLMDTARIVLGGISMGGAGTFEVGSRAPDLFSAMNPVVGYTLPNFARVADIRAVPSTRRPPVVDILAILDAPNAGIYAHQKVIKAYAAARQGYWGQWLDGGHSLGDGVPVPHPSLPPGGVLRFQRNEAFPAFTNCSGDDDYGRTDTALFARSGFVNGFLDWTSAYHDLGLPGDDLIDHPDTVAFTFQSLKDTQQVDVTPRRLQRFKVMASRPYRWKNLDVSSGACIQDTVVLADTAGLMSASRFIVRPGGNRLVITRDENELESEGRRIPQAQAAGLFACPNPFQAGTTIRINLPQGVSGHYSIYSATGSLIRSWPLGKGAGKALQWDGKNNSQSPVTAGLYLGRCVLDHGKILTNTLLLMK